MDGFSHHIYPKNVIKCSITRYNVAFRRIPPIPHTIMTRISTIIFIMAAAVSAILSGCIEDGFTSSPSDLPSFSVDTLKMGTVITEEGTATYRFTVRNRHSKGLNISSITIGGENAGMFRMNVDGMSGQGFSNVEIRAKDSIYIFVEATLPSNGQDIPEEVRASIDFITNGVAQEVVLSAFGQDVTRYKAHIMTEDTDWNAGRPYRITDSLVVAENATLTLHPGTVIYFHDKSSLIVHGTLISHGTPSQPVVLTGDRQGNVVGQISFDLMSNQWEGVTFTPSSKGNTLEGTIIKNTTSGVFLDHSDMSMTNCVLRNSGGNAMNSIHSDLTAVGCEFAEAAKSVLRLEGGRASISHCTLANYYLFSGIRDASLSLAHITPDEAEDDTDTSEPLLSATIDNTIIFGNGSTISHGDLTGTQVYLRRCLLKNRGTDDDNFINCVWDSNPLYYTEREKYIFDYRLKENSPAIGAADPSMTPGGPGSTDRYGLPRGAAPDLGAYVYMPPEEESN